MILLGHLGILHAVAWLICILLRRWETIFGDDDPVIGAKVHWLRIRQKNVTL